MRYAVILMLLVSYLHTAVQVALANNKWQLVGVNGVYIDSLASQLFGTSGVIISDIVDANSQETSYYAGVNTVASTVVNDNTIGIMALEDAISPTGDTTLSVGTSVSFEIDNALDYDSGTTRYRMYIAGNNKIPAIRVDFQSNLSGKEFKVKFGTESLHYIAYFNPIYTFNNPQVITESSTAINNISKVSLIEDIIDVNLSDNNLSQLLINNASGFINPIPATREVNATFYTLSQDGAWSLWDSRNSISGTNGFNSLSSGRAYWTFFENSYDNPNHGIILGDQGINETTHDNLYNGWNMISFGDGDIRYSPTGFFIELSQFASGISISYKDTQFESNVTATTSEEAARIFNWNIAGMQKKLGSFFEARAYPALKSLGLGATPTTGIIIISNDKMDIDIPDAYNLSGNKAIPTTYGKYASTFGDYLLGFTLGDLSTTDINQTINILMPNYNSNLVQATDLSQTNKNISADNILDAFKRVAISISQSGDANVSVFRIDVDFNSTSALDYETMLMSSNARFAIQDANFIKTFKLVKDGKAVIVGNESRPISSILDINTYISNTNVKYYDLLNNEFMIVSNTASNLDLLENSGYTMYLDDPDITNIISQGLSIGAVGDIYTHKNLLSSSIGYDMEPIVANIANYNSASATDGYLTNMSNYTDDLAGPYMVALDFPTDSPLNTLAVYDKTISQILTADTIEASSLASNSIYWRITDLTKDPEDWFDTVDTQGVFNLKKEKGYWANIKNLQTSPLGLDASSRLVKSVITHFDNNVTLDGTKYIGLVTNHINHRLSLNINGLSPLDNTGYDIKAIIKGKEFPILASGIRFDLQINDTYMQLEESQEGSSNDDAILINIYDGLGNKITNTDFTVNFIKPARPDITWEEFEEMTIKSNDNDYQIHNASILDTNPSDSILVENASNIYDKGLSWEDVDGNVSLLRVVSIKDGVYSNMAVTPFIPFKDSHILQVRNNQEVDKIPYSFISKGILKTNGIETDNGVQITNLQSTKVMMSYRPNTIEGQEKLSSFTGVTSSTMYLSIDIAGAPVVTSYITYITSYAGKYFYIYYNNELYQGIFQDSGTYAYASNAYDLTSGSMDFSDLSKMGNQGNLIVFSGYTTNSQPIHEPSIIVNPAGGAIIPAGGGAQTGGGLTAPTPILPTH